ncbi:CBN-SEC-16 protein [Caenorhabditis brenneri]|uniref:Protein transport protein sec16 n=1 Tax=Caenorhabditis brenneri TaxID=135651 RepID=G0MJV7_CAEBE|nr:CBN-SEC-16 protein [Caenorhabditis brenneri]
MIDSMKYDQRVNGGVPGYNMNDWNQPYSASPPSSRNGEDDGSSVTHSRPPRRSRLDKDIPHSRGPILIQPAPPQPRKNNKPANMPMNNGGSRGHNSTFNGYDLPYKRYQHNSSRGPNESFSGIYTQSRNVSGYASDYMNSRMSVGLINNTTEPRRPRSTAAEKYTQHVAPRNGFGGYESGESENNSEELIDEEEENEEVVRALYMEARRAQGSRSVTNTLPVEHFGGEDEKYYFGVVKLGSQMVDHVLRTMPPPEEYLRFKPLERVAYIFYCAVYKKPYQKIQEFRNIFNREYFNYVCAGDTDETALYKICKSMQDQYTLKQLEASRLAYEKAQKEAAESEKLDFNQHRIVDPDEHKVAISQPEEVLSNGPLHYHSCLQFATIGVGGKLVVIRPAGTIDAVSGHVLSTTSVHVDDLRTLLHFDEQSGKVIESVQNFKGPLIAGQTPTHSVRLYIQRQIDALRQMRNSGDVKKSEVVDALLIWQLLEIMVQQHGRVTGPDIATLLTVASEELAEKTGIPEGGAPDAAHKSEAKERFNKFLLGGHINEAVESAISDGLYADAMTLIRRLHPNDAKKIEEIETRFMNLRSIDDPFATLVAVANDQLPPILTNSAFDDDNNWKRHAAIVLANLSSQTAMLTIYRLGLLLARRNRNCAADFCLLVCCILACYDPFSLPPSTETEGQERSREHIGLVHSGSSLLNRVDGLSGTAGFSFTDLHATDIFDYALRLGNNNINSPLAKSVDYQMARIEYAKKLASYGGFATDAFRYCTEVARSLWMYIGGFDKSALLDLCDLAESLQYVAATTPAEVEWIASMRMMLDGAAPPQTQNVQAEQVVQQQEQVEDHSLASEAQKWHDDHQAPIEITKRGVYQEEPPSAPPVQLVQEVHQQPVQLQPPQQYHPTSRQTSLPPPTISSTDSSYESTKTGTSLSTETVDVSTSRASTIEPTPPPPRIVEQPVLTPPPMMTSFIPEMPRMVDSTHSMSPPQKLPQMTPPPMTPTVTKPITIASNIDADLAKSPRTELEDLWGAAPPTISQPVFQQPPATVKTVPSASMVSSHPPVSSAPTLMQPTHGQPSVPNSKTTAPPTPKKSMDSSKNEQNSSSGWFGSIRQKIIKSIPSSNQMILPDDKKPSIVWDEEKKRYVGAGVEEEVVAPPPPVMSAPHLMGGADSNKSSTSSLRNARSGVGSRYLQSGMATSQTPSMDTGMPSMMPPTMMPLPTSFSFMPAATDDDSSEYADPFSAEANPTIPSESGLKQNQD